MKLEEKKLKELKDKKISIEDLNDRYFISSRDKVEVDNILKLLNENICSFKQIMDKFKGLKDENDDPCLYKLLYKLSRNEKLSEELIQNNRLNKEDLRYLLNRIHNDYELNYLSKNTVLLKHIVENELFEELIDRFKSIEDEDDDPCLNMLLWNEELFEELIKNNTLTTDDLKYLLNKIDTNYELNQLCEYTSLISYILNEFVLNKEDVDRLNRMIEKIDWRKEHNIHTIFDLIEYCNENNEEVLKLNELNKKAYIFDLFKFNLNNEQRLELIELLKNNEIAQNRLIYIIDNQLENNYDFNSLMRYLKKKEKKSLLNI